METEESVKESRIGQMKQERLQIQNAKRIQLIVAAFEDGCMGPESRNVGGLW